jgi:hypothetical protein
MDLFDTKSLNQYLRRFEMREPESTGEKSVSLGASGSTRTPYQVRRPKSQH